MNRQVTLALGVLSGALPPNGSHPRADRFARRRSIIRRSWLTFPNAQEGVVVRFVVRCGANWHGAPVAESDVLCAPVPAGGRLTGPILALHWWLQHALTAFATARFFGKADDDVYLHLPGIEAMLRGLPAEAAPYSYLGKMMYKIATERTTSHIPLTSHTCLASNSGMFSSQRSKPMATARLATTFTLLGRPRTFHAWPLRRAHASRPR